MGKFTATALVVVVLVGVAGGVLLLAHSTPSTDELQRDIAAVHKQLQEADADSAKYAGGAIKLSIDLRREILRDTEAMLEQKDRSILRRIDLQYSIAGKEAQPANAEKLKQIATDLENARTTLAKDNADAARYTGGLIQVMKLMTVATDQLTVAQLTLTYYSAKYGMPVQMKVPNTAPSTGGAPGKVVKDKDAF